MISTRLGAPRFAFLLVILGLPLFSGGCGSTLLGHLQDTESLDYQQACVQRADVHVGDVNSGRYFMPQFYVARWPLAMPASRKLDETALVEHLVRGEARFVLISARAGLGKSRLAEAIDARVCGKMPVFKVDLFKDIVPLMGKGNPFLTWLGNKTALSSPDKAVELDALLRSQRWLLMVDALEEVPLNKRAALISALQELRGKYAASMQVVLLARPSILDVDYSIKDFDAKVRILPIDRERADAFLARLVKNEQELVAIKAFFKAHGFDEIANFGFQPIYPMMSTYRDVIILRKLAARAVNGRGVASHAAAYEYLIGQRLAKELKQMSWGQREVLDMVDRMVAVHREQQGASTPFFNVDNCMHSIDPKFGWTAVDAGVGGDARARRRQVCEKVLQSIIFQASGDARGDKGVWHFAGQSIADLFAARWVNNQLARLPAGDCSAVEKNRALFSSGSIVRFLVGQPMVQRCIGPVFRVLCDGPGATKIRHLEQVITGLPQKRRTELVAVIRGYEAGQGPNACVLASLGVIAGSQGQ